MIPDGRSCLIGEQKGVCFRVMIFFLVQIYTLKGTATLTTNFDVTLLETFKF